METVIDWQSISDAQQNGSYWCKRLLIDEHDDHCRAVAPVNEAFQRYSMPLEAAVYLI